MRRTCCRRRGPCASCSRARSRPLDHPDERPLQREGFGYEGNPQDVSASWGPFASLRFYRNKAHVDVVFEAQQPPPPAPDVEIRVLRVSDGGDTGGIASAGQALRVVFKSNRTSEAATFSALDINGTSYTVVSASSGAFAASAQEVWTPSLAGTYVLRATATTPFGGTVPVSTTVRIVAAGGGIETDNGAAPRVLDQSTQPRAGAKGVPTSSFITVAFSEPVVGVSLSTVHLTRADIVPAPATAPETPEAFRISGVTAAGQIVPDVLQSPTLPITAITIQAISGLKYHQTYTLRLTDGIRDLDTASGAAAPKSLAPYETSFQTFGPEAIPPDEDAVQSYTTTGFYVARDANGEPLSMWALKHQISGSTWMGLLTGLDVSDPMNITEISSTSVFGRPVDLAGESTTLVVGTAPGARSMPSNVHLYDVSNTEAPAWLGSVSVANSAGQGALQRLTLRGNRIYTGTLRRGIQVIDVDQLRSLMVPCCSNAHFKMRSDLNLDGQGFGTEAIAATIPVPGPNGLPASFTGLKTIATGAEPLIVAAGNFGLALARESAPGAARVWHPEKDGITLERADALDVTDVGGYSLAVVAGFEAGRRQLMVVDITDPTAPFVRSVREIAGDLSVVDVLADGATVYVSMQKTTTPAALAVQVFEISDPAVIAYLGEVSGVAGRLALVGKLLYGATNGTFGAPIDGLGGVRTAALGTVALIEGTNPAVVVVGEGPRAAEDFKLKYRVIPSSAEVESARIEYRHGDATVGAPVAAALDPQGRGELPLSLGFTFPAVGESVARPRLVVRTPGGDEIVGPVRSWRHDQPTLELVFADEQEDYVSADDPQVKVELVSAEWARRAEVAAENGQPEPPAKAIAFEALLPPASVSPAIALSSDGIFETTLHTSTQPQQDRFVRAKVGEVLLAETAAVSIEPGEPSEANSTLESSKSAIPADDLTKVLLTLVARDQHGNLVGDGTPVIWEKGDGADGEFVEAQEGTSDGRATVEYRAGVDPGPVSINVHVGEALLTTTIQQAALGVVLLAPATRSFFNKTPLPLEVQVTSAAGPVANGTKVGWFSTTGRVGETQPTTDGVARAAWDPAETTWRPRVDFVVMVGQGRAQQRMNWTRTVETGTLTSNRAVRFASLRTHAASPLAQGATEPRHVAVSPSVIAGDIQGDQLVPFERADGSFEQVPVKATASYQAFGLVPGERVTVRLGTNRNPNVAPILHLTGEEKEGAVVPDATGAHDGQAAGGVSLKPNGYKADAFTFGGSGLGAGSSVGITVPDHPDFAFTGGFMVQAAVRPPPAGSGINDGSAGVGTLIKKGNGFALDLVELNGELRARFTIQTATGPEFVTSSLPVAREGWSLVTGKYESGRIFVGLENALESTFISSAPMLTTDPLEIGPGFRGDLDEIRVFDLTQAPLSTFGNGQQALSFVADQSGEFQTPILATGALSAPRIAAYYQSLSDETRSAIGGPNAEDLASPLLQAPGASAESRIGLATIEAETYWNDTAETATTRIGFVSASTMAFFAKLSHAVVIGAGGAGDPPDLALVAGDMLGSTFLAPVTILRDVATSSERLIRGSATGQDGLDLALGVANLGASLVKGKASALLKLGPLAKAIARTGKGSKTIARLIAFETSLAAGASGVSRIKKLVEVVNYSALAATLVGGVLDAVGDDEESVGHLNNVLEESNTAPESPTEIPDALNEMGQQLDVVDFKHALAGFGATDDGNPAGDAGSVARGARATKKTLTGMTVLLRRTLAKKQGIRRGVAGSLARRASGQMHRAAGLTRTERKDVLEKFHALLQHPRDVVGVEDLFEGLARARGPKDVYSALAHLDDALDLARKHPTKTIGIEIEVELLASSVGGPRQRRVDTIVTDLSRLQLEDEVRRAKALKKLGIDPSHVKGTKESASWVTYYAGGFPASLKGRPGWPIKGKLNQLLKELCDGNADLVKGGEFVPLLADSVPRGPFIAKLRAFFKSRIKVGNPFIEKHFRLPNESSARLEARLATLRPLVDGWVK